MYKEIDFFFSSSRKGKGEGTSQRQVMGRWTGPLEGLWGSTSLIISYGRTDEVFFIFYNYSPSWGVGMIISLPKRPRTAAFVTIPESDYVASL
jgi:hypothetical protein